MAFATPGRARIPRVQPGSGAGILLIVVVLIIGAVLIFQAIESLPLSPGAMVSTPRGETSGAPAPIVEVPAHTSHGLNLVESPSTDRWWNVTDFVGKGPSSRMYPLISNDPQSRHLVVAGGISTTQGTSSLYDTWTYGQGSWTNVSATVSRQVPEVGGLMTYDAIDGYALEFGGAPSVWSPANTNSTWEFDGRNWTNLSSSIGAAPPATSGFAAEMVYDASSQEVLLTEHYPLANLSSGLLLTWTYAHGRWTNITSAAGQPSIGIVEGSMTYDAADGYVLQYGGFLTNATGADSLVNATWKFQNGTWSQVTITGSGFPNPRVGAVMCYDAQLGAVVLFGGGENLSGGTGSSSLSAQNDSWEYSSGVWTNVTSTLGLPVPPAWSWNGAYDSADGYLVLFPTYGPDEYWVLGDPPPFVRLDLTAGPFEQNGSYQMVISTMAGSPPYTYRYDTLPPGCPSGVDFPVLNCTATVPGNFSISVTVTDSIGRTSNASIAVQVLKGVASILQISPSTIHLGDQVSVNVTPEHGVPPYSIGYSGLPAGCVVSQFTLFSCTPDLTGQFNVTAWVNDSAGGSASSTAQLSVYSRPTVTAPRLSPAWIDLGDTTQIRVTVSGGAPALTFAFVGLPTGCASTSEANLSCTPTETGDFAVHVEVTDGLGASANSSIVHLRVEADPRIGSVTVSPNQTLVGLPIEVNTTISGGTAPFSYRWSGAPGDCSASGLSFTCTPETPGSYVLVLNATDALGHSTSARAMLTVATPAPAGGLAITLPIVAGLGIAGIAVIAISFAIRHRRRANDSANVEMPSGEDPGSTDSSRVE